MQTNLYTSNSNGKRFIWIKLILFTIVLISLLNYIGNYFESINKENKVRSAYKIAWDEFYKVEKNTLDLVFIGSSHAYCTFDPEIIDKSIGTNSFNFGSPLQHANSSYYVLKEVLKYQQPKVVVFELYWDMLDNEFELNQAETIISAINRKEFEVEFIKNTFPINEMVKYFFKPVRYQQDVFNYWNKELKETVEKNLPQIEEEEEKNTGVSYHRSKGFIYSNIVIPKSKFYEDNQFIGFDAAKWDFNKTQKSYIEKIVKLCREEGIKPIFVTAPVANVSMEHIKNYNVIHEKIAGLAKELDVPYRDYNMVNMENHLFVNENFRDDAHLNYSGVEIFMKDFIEWYSKVTK